MSRLMPVLLLSCLLSATACAAEPVFSPSQDPLRGVLLESKEKSRGVTIHANGNNIGMVVTAMDEHYVIGRSQLSSRIVLRLDRIDGVSTMF